MTAKQRVDALIILLFFIAAGCSRFNDLADSHKKNEKIPEFYEGTITPDGGVLEFNNGITFTVPAGAVTEAKDIKVRKIAGSEFKVIRSRPDRNWKITGGFVGEPDGTRFNQPITVTCPIEELDSFDNTYLFMNIKTDTLKYTTPVTKFTISEDLKTVQYDITSFSADAVVEAETMKEINNISVKYADCDTCLPGINGFSESDKKQTLYLM